MQRGATSRSSSFRGAAASASTCRAMTAASVGVRAPLGAPARMRASTGLRTCSAIKASWFGVETVLKNLRERRQFDKATVERVYEADCYPGVFDFKLWKAHRSRSRYLEHAITGFRSYLLRDLSGPLLTCALWSVGVAAYNTAVEAGVVPHSLAVLHAAWEPFNLMSFALSLMLVHRTTSSYARWVEARALWGNLINANRSLVRQALTCMPERQANLKLAIARWSVAAVRACKLHLRENPDVHAEMASVLLPHEVALIASASHLPVCTFQMLSHMVMLAPELDANTRARLEAEVTNMQSFLGSSEKLLRNPIPLSYTRHTARFLVLWLSVLPFTLWDRLGLGIIPCTTVIAYLLLGIDEIAIQLEEPFGILPLENLCDTAQHNVQQMLHDDDALRRLARQIQEEEDELQAPSGWKDLPKGSLQVATSMLSDTDADVEGPPAPGGGHNGGSNGNGVLKKELLGTGSFTSRPGG